MWINIHNKIVCITKTHKCELFAVASYYEITTQMVTTESACPPEFTLLGPGCFHANPDSAMKWDAARGYCTDKDEDILDVQLASFGNVEVRYLHLECVCGCGCVTMCGCVCVLVPHSHSWLDKHKNMTFGVEFKLENILVWHVGQSHGSKIRVTRSMNTFMYVKGSLGNLGCPWVFLQCIPYAFWGYGAGCFKVYASSMLNKKHKRGLCWASCISVDEATWLWCEPTCQYHGT